MFDTTLLKNGQKPNMAQKVRNTAGHKNQPNPTPMIQPNHDSGAHFHVKILFKIDYPR